MEKVQRVQSVRPEKREAQGSVPQRHEGPKHRRARLMSNAQIWFVLIASTFLIFAAIMEFGGKQ